MQITLNKDSWHFKYYSWVKDNDNAPKSLCPYFWTMVVFIVFSPLILFFKGVGFLISKLPERKSNKVKVLTEEEQLRLRKREQRIERIVEVIGKILFGIFLLAGMVLVSVLLYSGVKKVGILGVVRSIFTIVGMWATVYFIIDRWVENNWGRKIIHSKVIQIPVTMIKSIYNKACPIIKWTTTNQVLATNEKVN